MLWRIGHNMVDVVIALPPSHAEPSKIVCNDDSDHRVDVEVVSDAHMAGIMSREDELVPEAAKEESGRAIPTPAEKDIRERRKKGISTALDEICKVIAVVETFRADPLVQSAVLFHDVVLGRWFQRRILGQVENDLLLSPSIEEEWPWFELLICRRSRGYG